MAYNPAPSAPSVKSVLTDVYAKVIPLDENLTRRARAVITNFVTRTFLNQMKAVDSLFRSLFQEVFFTGSFYDGLRIGEATEFDLNIVLRLPFCLNDLKVCNVDSQDVEDYNVDVVPGYAFLCSEKSFNEMLHPNHPRYFDYQGLNRFFEHRSTGIIFGRYYYVIRPKSVLHWFEGVIAKALNQLIYDNKSWLDSFFNREVYLNSGVPGEDRDITVTALKSGPAFTLVIESKADLEIHVDLVPVFEFYGTFLVPKLSNDFPDLWRLSYPKQERQIIHDQSCAKKVIKLLKRFRDMQGAPWVKLSSYYLKTLVMLELKDTWHEKDLGDLFIQVLYKLRECLVEGKIPFYFDPRCNLLANVNDATIDNMRGRLDKILIDIETNPPITLWKYFVIPECETRTVDGSDPASCILL